MAYWKSRGLRGSAFEELISLTNRLYRERRLAVIQKVPTPITPVAVNNETHTISAAYFEQKSTVDFIGVAQGVAICFDAKETRYKNLPLKNIHRHQIEFMEAFRRQEGIAFLLVRFVWADEVFFLPVETLSQYHSSAALGGRKSIPYEAFDRKYLVQNKNGFPIHYLEAVNIYLQE
ncbi:MAG: Holliday junction resolvase RecU [Defluviitaleaceae bacterium]|nr:Holliday junction resolvase RecU [Defluviitaleaceae bacterium]